MVESIQFKINKDVKYKLWRSKIVGDILPSSLWMYDNDIIAMSYMLQKNNPYSSSNRREW